MLFLLIPAAWLAVLFFAWAICRLAALSDGSRAEASSEAIATGRAPTPEAQNPDEQQGCDVQRAGFRATG